MRETEEDRPKSGEAADVLRPALAIGLIIVIGFMLSTMDAIAKHLSKSHALLIILWGRYFFHAILTFAVLASGGSLAFLKAKRPGLQFLRAACLIIATGAMFHAVSLIPLANATAVMFVYPLLITALSVPLLGEHVGPLRWAAVFVGFIGILLIVRPGADTFSPIAVLPLVTAFSVATYMILTRMLHGKDNPAATTFYATAVGAVVLTALLPFNLEPMAAFDWLLLLAMGGVGAVGHYLLVVAFSMAPASLLAPFTYSHLVGSAILGVIFFADVPDAATFAGAALVVGSGLFVWYRESFAKGKLDSGG